MLRATVKTTRIPASKSSAFSLISYGVACAFGAIAGFIYTAPASLLGSAIANATGEQLALVNASGSIWSGYGSLVLKGGKGSSTELSLPSVLNWSIKPTWTGLQVNLSSSCCTTNEGIEARISPSKLEIQDAYVQLPLQLLSGLGSPWNTLGLRGDVQLRSFGFAVSLNKGKQLSGNVEALVSKVSTSLSTLPDLGSFKLVLEQQSEAPQVRLSTLEGALNLDGIGVIERGKFKFEGTGQATPESASALANLLTLLGDKQGNKTKIRLG